MPKNNRSSAAVGENPALRLLRVPDIARRTGLFSWRVYQLLAQGKMPSMRIGKTYVVSELALSEWIRNQHSARPPSVAVAEEPPVQRRRRSVRKDGVRR